MTKQYIYSIVVPVFNEEEVLDESYKRLKTVMDSVREEYEIVFIDDGSTDKGLEIMKQLNEKDKRVKIISFSRNFGHQIAITAGMDYARGKAVIVIDADLQDPPEVIKEFIKKWKEGYEVVYGIRAKREGERLFKKITAKLFYQLLQKISNTKAPLDAGDFRLLDRKVVDVLKNIRERNRYMRGLTSWVGFRQIGVYYKREKRFAGYSKYPLKKMIRFAIDAIFSFSGLPLKIAGYIGFLVTGFSFLYLIYVVYIKLFTNAAIPGWTSLMVVILFLGGVQLLSLGIIGEYVGRIGAEVKKRPLYIIKKIIDKDKQSNKNNGF